MQQYYTKFEKGVNAEDTHKNEKAIPALKTIGKKLTH